MTLPSPSVTARLHLRVLGALEVRLARQRAMLATRKMTAVLVYLALEGAATRGKLAALLWSDNTDLEARRNLRRELHRLRAIGLGDHLATHGETVALEDFTCDALELSAALEHGDSSRAAALCNGELLEGVQVDGADGFADWLEEARGRWRSLSARALTLEAARLETDDPRGALTLLEQALTHNPLEERVHRDLMRVQARLGQVERALEVYARLKRVLRDELGLEPMSETARLALEIRGVAPEAAVSPAQSALNAVPFVGRADVVRRLRTSSGVVLVSGAPGIGKSRLVAEVAPRAWVVQFTEAGSRTPLSAIVQTLRAAWDTSYGRVRLEALPASWHAELARLLPEAGTSAAAPDEGGRVRFVRGIAAALSVLGEVVVEDLHWADALGVDVLAQLASGSARLIVTARAEDLCDDHPATPWLNDLRARGGLSHVTLEPLTAPDLGALGVAINGGEAQVWAARLERATRGNPLYAIEALRYAAGRGASEPLVLPPNLSALILARIKRLGAATWRVLEVASLAGGVFSLREVQRATALSVWEALEGVERALAAGVLERVGEALTFHHELIRDAVATSLSPERRALAHRELATALAAHDAAPERVAHHLERAGLGTRAVRWRLRGAREAMLVYAHQEALAQYALALEHERDAASRFAIIEATLPLHYALGQPEARRAAVDALQALATTPELQARALLARVTLEYDLGHYAHTLTLTAPLLESSPDDDVLEAVLLYDSIARLRLGALEDADAGLTRGLELARAQGSGRVNEFLLYRATIATYQGRYAEAQAHNDAILTGARTGDWVELDAQVNRGRFAAMLGDVERGVRALGDAVARARALHSDSMLRFALLGLTGALTLRWMWREARPLVLENLALMRAAHHKIAEIVMLDRLAHVERLRGDLGAALGALTLERAETRAAQASGSEGMVALSHAALLLDIGDTIAARAELHIALERPGGARASLVHADLDRLGARRLAPGRRGRSAALPRVRAHLLGAHLRARAR
jgi:DNA-binding SARP family transcriptional activator